MNNPDIVTLREKLGKLKGERDYLLAQIDKNTSENKRIEKDIRQHEQALAIVKEVGLQTQRQLQYHISDIGTMALEAIFPDPYALQVEFEEKRGNAECNLLFERDGNAIDPLSASGGGAVDVAAFALRVASWAMERPRSRSTLLLDEPFRYLSENLLPDAGKMVQELSKELGLQIILITHSEALIDTASKVLMVSQKNGVSQVH